MKKNADTTGMSSSSSSMKISETKSAIEEISMLLIDVRFSHTLIPFQPFISLCKLVLQVLDKIGPAMTVLRQDIHHNIQRLELVYETDATKYSNLVEILNKESAEGSVKSVNSCVRAFLWLTRSLDFSVALLQNLLTEESDKYMDEIVEKSYNSTLKKSHGWISSAAVKVALKLVPDRKTFVNAIKGKDDQTLDSLKEEMQTSIALLIPILEEIHSCLKARGVDRLKST